MSKLTREMLIAGVNPDDVKIAQLKELISDEGLDVVIKGGMSKVAAMNLIMEALEKRNVAQGPTEPEQDELPEGLAADPALPDLGSNALNRRRPAIMAAEKQGNPLGNMEEDAKKSSVIARRLKSMKNK